MSDVDPRIASVMEHVQRAALELIAAMRDALDVAEDLVADPHALQSLWQGAAAAAATAATAATSAAAAAAAPTSTPERVQRIRVDD